jgi:ABC-type multidrug transport system fused ATPase/permease subunit
MAKKERPKFSKESWKKAKRVFRYFAPYKFMFGLGFVFLILTSLTGLIFPYVVGDLIGNLNLPQSSPDPFWEMKSLNALLILLIAIFVAQAIFSYFRVYIFNWVTENALNGLRKDAFSHILSLPMSFFNANKTGELTSRLGSDITTLQESITTTLAEAVRQTLTIIGGVIFISFISLKLTLIMLSSLPVVIIITIILGKFIKRLSKKVQENVARSTQQAEEAFGEISVVKSFSSEEKEANKFGKIANDIRNVAINAVRFRALFISFIILFMTGTIAFVIWYGASMKQSGEISSAAFTQFLMYTIILGMSMGSLPNMIGRLIQAIGSTEKLMDIIDTTNEQPEIGTKEIPNGDIEIKNLSFQYPSRPDVTVLNDLNLIIPKGSKTALVGGSGAGKTTIVQLLMRFYQWEKGEILLDGKDIKTMNLRALRSKMAWVPQEISLFNGSILENIAYGKEHSTEEEVIAAAKQANAHEFIMNFPEGYQTEVGNRGIQLSGGQRQRVAIARAILKDPQLLILDEATSNLDSESEKLVQDALENLLKGRTSIIIAHRLSTIKDADKILVLNQGKIIEQGGHQELLDKDGVYKKMLDLQYNDRIFTS